MFYLVFFFRYSFAYAQVEEEMLYSESSEEQEEFQYKIRGKLSMNEFLADPDLYLHYINEKQHSALQQYIVNTGEMLDLMELQTIPEFSEREYRLLLPIIEFSSLTTIQQQDFRISSRWVYQSKVDTHFLGSPWAQYYSLKGKGSYGLSFGYALEQDVGEPFVFNHVLGFDHQSYYINRKWKNNELCLGDFQVFNGFGMLVGQGFSGAMGAGGISNFAQSQWVGKSNASEYQYFHGIFIRKRLGSLNSSIGYSNHLIDKGNSGYHRTNSEIAKRNNQPEKLFLFSVEHTQRKHREVVMYLSDIEHQNWYASLAFQYFHANSIYFSEFVVHDKSSAISLGTSLLIGKNSILNLCYLQVDSGYQSNWSGTNIQGFKNDLQRGVVANINFKLGYFWLLNCTYRISIKNPSIEALTSFYVQYYSIRFDRQFRGNLQYYSILQYQGNPEGYSKIIRTKSILRIKTQESISRELQFYLNKSSTHFSKGIGIEISAKTKILKAIYNMAYFELSDQLPIYYGLDLVNQGTQHIGVFDSGFIQSMGVQCSLFRHYQIGISALINDVNSIHKLSFYIKRK